MKMTDTQRDAFEAWCDREGIHTQLNPLTGIYESPTTRVAWRSWQAAQAADAGREPVAYETTDANGDQELLYASYLAKQSTEEERARFMVPLYYEPNAYRLAAINAELVDALEALLGPEDDPHIGWWGTAQTSINHFRCEHCGVEDLDSVKLPHKDDCRVVKARATLSRAKEQM
jgi:hypothetical protein